MSWYKVRFYDLLCDGEGGQRKVCRRTIEVLNAASQGSAVDYATELFAAAERILDWRARAQLVEAERMPTEAAQP